MAEIYVDMGERRRAESPDVLFTHGLRCCMGLAIYSPKKMVGYLSHRPDHASLEWDADAALAEFGSASGLQVLVAGGTLESEESDSFRGDWLVASMGVYDGEGHNVFVAAERDAALEMLARKGLTNIRNRFAGHYGVTTSVWLYTINGKVRVVEESDEICQRKTARRRS